MFLQSTIAAAILTFSSMAFAADEPVTFNVDIARVQADVNCTISQANGGSTECGFYVKETGKQTIVMTQDEKTGHFVGADVTGKKELQYFLVLEADKSQALQSITMMKMASSQKEFSLDLAASRTNSLAALNISPLKIQILDEQTVSIQLSTIVYAPATTNNIVTKVDQPALTALVLKTIKPAITAAQLQLK